MAQNIEGGPGLYTNKRTAKLVELVDEDLNPVYKFKDSSIDFRNPSRERGSNLVYLTYSDNLDEKDVKHQAMKTFEDNYCERTGTQGLFLGSGRGIFDFGYKDKSIDEIKEMRNDTENTLEQLKAKNFYNPRKFKQSPGAFKGIKKIAGVLSGIGAGACSFGEYFVGGMWMFAGVGALELSRRVNKSGAKKELNSINQNIEYYDNFRRNIENSNIEIYSPQEAQEIYEDLQQSTGKGRFAKVDTESANQELISAYNRAY